MHKAHESVSESQAPSTLEAVSELQQRFVGSRDAHDAETIEFWRDAPAAAHAKAMIELASYAEKMAAQTGLGKDPNESFPGFRSITTGGGHQAR